MNLQFISLNANLITYAGCKELRKAVFDNSSLNSAADSNHTCVIYIGDEELECGINSDTGSDNLFGPKAFRGKKIYSILPSRNRECSNGHYLDNVPVGFLPDMFGAIQQYSEYHLKDNSPSQDDNDVNALSIMFGIVRRWDEGFSVYKSLSTSNGY